MPARITVCYTDQPAMESYLYEQSGYLIGRAKECQLILEHPTVSRQHARVSHSNDAWQLNDQRSLNGTKVNGAVVTHSTLADDAIISIGDLDCLFEAKSMSQIAAINEHNTWRLTQSKLASPSSNTDYLKESLIAQLHNLITLTGTQRGVLLLGEQLDSLQVCIAQGFKTGDFKLKRFEGSVGAISRCFEKAEPVMAMDVSVHDLLKHRDSIQLKKISSLACIPLLFDGRVVGVVYTDSQLAGKVLTDLDIEIFHSMGLQIEAAVQALLLQQSIDNLQKVVTDKHVNENTGYTLFNLCH